MTSRLRDQSAARCKNCRRFLLAILTMHGFVSTRHTNNNIYDAMPPKTGAEVSYNCCAAEFGRRTLHTVTMPQKT